MNCKNDLDIGKLVGVLILLLVLIYVLASIGRGQVNENVWPVYNKKHLSVGDFLIHAGEQINAQVEYHGWEVYKVRVLVNQNQERKYEIRTIWFYYD